MPIRSSCVRSSQRTSIANFAVPLIKPTLSADAQLLFSVTTEGLARLDIGDNTTSASACSASASHQFLLDLFLYLFRVN
jgi:hypothetical protein